MLDDAAREALRQLAEGAGYAASHAFARYWHAEAQKIAEAVSDPSARWEILVDALRRVGYGDASESTG